MPGLANPMHIPDKSVVQYEAITTVVELVPLETVSATVRGGGMSTKSKPPTLKETTLLSATPVLLAGYRMIGWHPILEVVVNASTASSIVALANVNLPML